MFCCRRPIVAVTCLFCFLLCPICDLRRLFIVVLSLYFLKKLSLSSVTVDCHCQVSLSIVVIVNCHCQFCNCQLSLSIVIVDSRVFGPG